MKTIITALNDPTDGISQLSSAWITPSQLHALFHKDPGLIWLEHHGAAHGFVPDESAYAFSDFITEKGRQFEATWLRHMVPGAPQVCADPCEARLPIKVQATLAHMANSESVIVQPALWWPEHQLYGVPDLIVLRSWLMKRFPTVITHIADEDADDHYVVIDLKFTSNLEERSKKTDRAFYEAQVRLYSAMLANIQNVMPQYAFLITRDRIADPWSVPVNMTNGQIVSKEIIEKCANCRSIKVNGANYTPWTHHEIVGVNAKRCDERWHTAKKIITQERIAGGALETLYYVGAKEASKIAARGYHCIADLLACDPATIDFERTGVRQRQLRAILSANRSGVVVRPANVVAPKRRRYEFYVDFEFFGNLNVNFEQEWPELQGCEMIFMVGIAWQEQGNWYERQFVATAESQDAEHAMLTEVTEFMLEQTSGHLNDPEYTALYHWSRAEKEQIVKAVCRHNLGENHVLANLPWVDLCQICEGNAVGIPGAWSYGLKEVAKALGNLDPGLDPHWPDSLGDGLSAQVMGWGSYRWKNPLVTTEMEMLKAYLSADCRALHSVLVWLRM